MNLRTARACGRVSPDGRLPVNPPDPLATEQVAAPLSVPASADRPAGLALTIVKSSARR